MRGKVAATGLYITSMVGAAAGYGRHVYYLTEQELSRVALLGLFVKEFSVYAAVFVKISLSLMLLRINIDGCKPFRWTIYMVIATNCAVAIAGSIWHYMECIPLSAVWDFTITHAVCLSHYTLQIWAWTASGKAP